MATAQERLEAYRRTVVIIAVVIFLYLAFMIVRPFLLAIIGSAVLAYLFYPLYKWLVGLMPKFLPRETISAIVTCLLIVVIVLIPLSFLTGLLLDEIANGYAFMVKVMSDPNVNIELPEFMSKYLGEPSRYSQQIATFSVQLIGWLQHVARGIPNVFLNLFITIFSVFFFLKGGKNLYGFFQDVFPLSESRYKEILNRLDDLSKGLFMGQIVVGLLHGVLAWIAYSMLGVPNPLVWAFVTSIISILPVLGAGLVWGPLAIFLFTVGLSNGLYWKGLVLLGYGLFVMTALDNILKPKIIGEHSSFHPLVVLIGILGGIQFMGLAGIIIGPLVLGLFDVVLGIFREVV